MRTSGVVRAAMLRDGHQRQSRALIPPTFHLAAIISTPVTQSWTSSNIQTGSGEHATVRGLDSLTKINLFLYLFSLQCWSCVSLFVPEKEREREGVKLREILGRKSGRDPINARQRQQISPERRERTFKREVYSSNYL